MINPHHIPIPFLSTVIKYLKVFGFCFYSTIVQGFKKCVFLWRIWFYYIRNSSNKLASRSCLLQELSKIHTLSVYASSRMIEIVCIYEDGHSLMRMFYYGHSSIIGFYAQIFKLPARITWNSVSVTGVIERRFHRLRIFIFWSNGCCRMSASRNGCSNFEINSMSTLCQMILSRRDFGSKYLPGSNWVRSGCGGLHTWATPYTHGWGQLEW